MLTKGNRTGGQPFLLEGDQVIKPVRIPFTRQGFPEEWMQRLLHAHPEVLPVEEIEAGFAPLIPVGREITRAIVRVESAQPEHVVLKIETDLGTEPARSPTAGIRRLITAEDFFEQLNKNKGPEAVAFAQRLIRDCAALGLETVWNSGSFSLKLPDPQGSGLRIGVFNVDRTGYVYLGYSQGQFEKLQLRLELSYDFAAQTAALLPGISQHPVQKGSWNKYATLDDFQQQYDRMLKIVAGYIEKIREEGRTSG